MTNKSELLLLNMLIGLVGPALAGKSTIAEYLVGHSFTRLSIVHGEPQSEHEFNCAAQVLDFVICQWKNNFVLTGIEKSSDWKVLLKRPFFLLIGVECPVGVRFQRGNGHLSLKEFVRQDDQSVYCGEIDNSKNDVVGGMIGLNLSGNASLFTILNHAHLKILNICQSVSNLYTYLDYLDLLNHERLRPSWDTYFMKLCDLAASRSNCT